MEVKKLLMTLIQLKSFFDDYQKQTNQLFVVKRSKTIKLIRFCGFESSSRSF